jgi:hypothetical protein
MHSLGLYYYRSNSCIHPVQCLINRLWATLLFYHMVKPYPDKKVIVWTRQIRQIGVLKLFEVRKCILNVCLELFVNIIRIMQLSKDFVLVSRRCSRRPNWSTLDCPSGVFEGWRSDAESDYNYERTATGPLGYKIQRLDE